MGAHEDPTNIPQDSLQKLSIYLDCSAVLHPSNCSVLGRALTRDAHAGMKSACSYACRACACSPADGQGGGLCPWRRRRGQVRCDEGSRRGGESAFFCPWAGLVWLAASLWDTGGACLVEGVLSSRSEERGGGFDRAVLIVGAGSFKF